MSLTKDQYMELLLKDEAEQREAQEFIADLASYAYFFGGSFFWSMPRRGAV